MDAHFLMFDLKFQTVFCMACNQYIFNKFSNNSICHADAEWLNNNGYLGLRGLYNLGNTC